MTTMYLPLLVENARLATMMLQRRLCCPQKNRRLHSFRRSVSGCNVLASLNQRRRCQCNTICRQCNCYGTFACGFISAPRQSATRIRTQQTYADWLANTRAAHVAACVFLAVTIYEPRHDRVFEIEQVITAFGEQHNFEGGDVADLQRKLCEALGFQFDLPTVAVLIDEALKETDTLVTLSARAKAALVQDLARLALQSLPSLSIAESVMTSLALLKRHAQHHHGCETAYQHLLQISGRHHHAVENTLLFLQRFLD
jgi:hypothetical protein